MKSCDNWEKGLFGEVLHSEKFCEIPPPKVCMYELTDRIQDFSLFDCTGSVADQAVIDRSYKISEPFIGLPDTTKMN